MKAILLSFTSREGQTAARLLPTAALTAIALALAWQERGSMAARDWLPYVVLAAALGVVVAVAGAATRPRPLPALAAGSLAVLAVWALASAAWSPAPSLARDEALLRTLYLVALLIPLTTLTTTAQRLAGLGVVVAGVGGVAVATAVYLLEATNVAALYPEGRLYYPITYPNAQAAFFVLAVWPAIGLAARPRGGHASRSLALGAAAACGGVAVMCQSKGAVAAFALSAIVVFGVSPFRLRLLVPTALVMAIIAVAFVPLTEPIRVEAAALGGAVRDAAVAEILLTAAAVLAGLAYVALDRRLRFSRRAVLVAGAVVWVAVTAAAGVGVAAFLSAVDDPGEYFAERWEELQSSAKREGFTHFTTLGSNRTDFWRVAVDMFEEDPIAGYGSRGFASDYLAAGESGETPARAHSLPLDVLSEEGVVGAALLLLVFAPLLGIALVRARGSVVASAVAGGAVYWLAHAAIDWNWSLPAVGIPLFALLGLAVGEPGRPLGHAGRAWTAAGAIGIAALAMAPWLSVKLTDRALADPATAARDLRWARRLDPISAHPLVAEWQLAQTPDAKIAALERALEREPESFPLRYFLGLTYRDAGQMEDARRELLAAKRRAPNVSAVDEALASLGG